MDNTKNNLENSPLNTIIIPSQNCEGENTHLEILKTLPNPRKINKISFLKMLIIMLSCNLYMIIVLLTIFSFKYYLNFALNCSKTETDSGNITYDKTRQECSLKCDSKIENGETEKNLAFLIYYISSLIQSMCSALFLMDYNFNLSVILYTLFVLGLRLIEVFIYYDSNVFFSILKSLFSVLIAPMFMCFSQNRKKTSIIYITIIYIVIIISRFLYEFLFREFFEDNNELIYSQLLPFVNLIFNIFFTQLIKLDTPRRIFPYLKVTIAFMYYSYYKSFSLGFNIFSINQNGITLSLILQIFIYLTIDLLNMYEIPKRFLYYLINKICKKKLKIKKKDDFRKILNSMIPYYDIFSFTILILTNITNTTFTDSLDNDIVDCYQTFNSEIYKPKNKYVMYLAFIYLIKNFLYVTLHKFIFVKYFPDHDFYIPDVNSLGLCICVIVIIGHNSMSIMLKGFYSGIILKDKFK